MDGRTRKRQKKRVLESSDSESTEEIGVQGSVKVNEEPHASKLKRPTNKSQRILPTRPREKEASVASRANVASKASVKKASAPSQGAKKAKKAKDEESKTLKDRPLKTISAFFAEQSKTKVRERKEQPSKPVPVEDIDAIEDVSPSSDDSSRRASSTKQVHGSQKFVKQPSVLNGGHWKDDRSRRSPIPAPSSVEAPGEDPDTRPWSERFAPMSITELAVNSKKVTEVKRYLTECVLKSSQSRLLVLKGPSGSGKSATLKLLANELNLDVLEWLNPTGSSSLSGTYTSMSSQFDDFLNRARHLGELCLPVGQITTTGARSHAVNTQNQARSRLVVVEDLPSNLAFNSSMLGALRLSVLQHLSINENYGEQPSLIDDTPKPVSILVFIFAETSSSASNSDDWALTPRRVLGPDILDHPNGHVIEFNPIAVTFLEKALNLVIKKQSKSGGNSSHFAPTVVKSLATLGNARSAINALQIFSIMPAGRGRQGIGSDSESLTYQDATLGLFHAVGKVVYNKREDDSSLPPCVHPPPHLNHKSRQKPSQVAVDKLFDETGTDASTFVATLFENFAPSCAGPAATTSLDECLEAISDADLLDSSRFRLLSGSSSAQGNELIRSGEFAFDTAVRGILFALPHPVRRSLDSRNTASRSGFKGDAFKMGFPALFRLGREIREMEDLVREAIYSEPSSFADRASSDSLGDESCRALFPTLPDMVADYLPHSKIIGVGFQALSERMSRGFLSHGSKGSSQSTAVTKFKEIDGLGSNLDRRGWQGNKHKDKERKGALDLPEHRESLILEDDDIEDD